MDAWATYHDELFHVRRSVKYHDHRRRFFENVLNVALFLAFASGPALVFLAVAALEPPAAGAGTGGWLQYAPAVLTSIFTGAALVARVGAKAREHNELKVEFIRLRQDMERRRRDATDEDAVADWIAQRLAIETKEPPINRIVDALCHNEVVQSMGAKDKTQYVRVLVWHRLVGPYTRYFDNGLRKYRADESRSVWA